MLRKNSSIVLLAVVMVASYANGAVTKYDTGAVHSNIGSIYNYR